MREVSRTTAAPLPCGLGPSLSSDSGRPGSTQGCLPGQPRADTEVSPPLCRCLRSVATKVGARSLRGQEAPPPLPLRRLISSPCLSSVRDPAPSSTVLSRKRKTLYLLLSVCGVRVGVIPTFRNTTPSLSLPGCGVGRGGLVFPK